MKRPSWLSYAASVVARCLEIAAEKKIRLTKLTLLVIEEVARSGVRCFRKIRSLAERIVQNNEKHPHPGSVQRVLRQLRQCGILLARRLFPSQKMQFKAHGKPLKVSAGQGCLVLWFNKRLDFPDFEDNDSHSESTATVAPSHAAPNAIVPASPALKVNADDLALYQRMAAPAIAVDSARKLERAQREDFAMYESVKRARGHPP